jgi:type IV secretory pathway VirB4 component
LVRGAHAHSVPVRQACVRPSSARRAPARPGSARGWATLRLRPGGGLRVNPLDTGPGHHTADHRAAAAHRAAVTAALLATALDQPDLTAGQHRLLAAATRRLSTRAATPTLADVRALLAHPDPTLATELDTTPGELADRRRPLLDACARLLDHDLAGICDGPTTPGLGWDTAPGLVLDLSALLSNRRALALVLTAAAGWLHGATHTPHHRHTLTVIDEGWVALADPATARFLHDQWRLGRQWDAANILITHALADLHATPATAPTAAGLLHTTSARVFLHQNPDQAGTLLTDMGLTGTEATLLGQLPPFTALWKIGPHTALVDHVVAASEWAFADTDTAMRGPHPDTPGPPAYRPR